jgi:CBS domain-containing protein
MPVVGRDGRLVGVVSEADLLRGGVPYDARRHLAPLPDVHAQPASTVGEIMSTHPVVAHSDDDVARVVEIMTSTAFKSLPVVDRHHRPVGMISRRDIVHRLARTDELVAAEIDRIFREIGVDWAVTVDQGNVTVAGPESDKARALAEAAVSAVSGVRSVHVVEPG